MVPGWKPGASVPKDVSVGPRAWAGREEAGVGRNRVAGTALALGCGAWMSGGALACDVESVADEASAMVQRAVDAAESWVETRILDVARDGVSRSHGLFVYTPGVGDVLDGNWSDGALAPRTAHAVVLVHGLDEPGSVWSDLAPALDAAGHVVLRVDYPNDQSIAASGEFLFEALRRARAMGIERVSIVGHSMGGLVAREMLTCPEMFGGEAEVEGVPRVERLIAVGTPFEGSPLARFRFVGEIRDQIARFSDAGTGDVRGLLGFLYDGGGEAGVDLMPGSAYLSDAWARPVSPEIAVTSIVGRMIPVSGGDVRDALGDSWFEWIAGEDAVHSMAEAAERAVDMVGDGAVSEMSACAFPSADEVVVRANHRSLLRRAGALRSAASLVGAVVEEPPAIAEILERVEDAAGR